MQSYLFLTLLPNVRPMRILATPHSPDRICALALTQAYAYAWNSLFVQRHIPLVTRHYSITGLHWPPLACSPLLLFRFFHVQDWTSPWRPAGALRRLGMGFHLLHSG